MIKLATADFYLVTDLYSIRNMGLSGQVWHEKMQTEELGK